MWWICISELISAVWRFSFEDRKPGYLRLVLKVWLCCDICFTTRNTLKMVPHFFRYCLCGHYSIINWCCMSAVFHWRPPPHKPVTTLSSVFTVVLWFHLCDSFLHALHLASKLWKGKCVKMLSHCITLWPVQVWFLRFWWGKKRWKFLPTWRILWSSTATKMHFTRRYNQHVALVSKMETICGNLTWNSAGQCTLNSSICLLIIMFYMFRAMLCFFTYYLWFWYSCVCTAKHRWVWIRIAADCWWLMSVFHLAQFIWILPSCISFIS